MSTDDVESDVQRITTQWAFIQRVETIDKTDFTVKLRLHVATECFIQATVDEALRLVIQLGELQRRQEPDLATA